MSDFWAGETLYIDRALKVEFVRFVDDASAIVRLGQDTRVVSTLTLSREEA